MNTGILLVLEGPDGSGKTTQIAVIKSALEALGYSDIVTTREPGGCPLAEDVRYLLLNKEMTGLAEVLLFAGARAQHIHETINPALERGAVVICDRFTDSSYAYQGFGRKKMKEMLICEKMVLSTLTPKHDRYNLFFLASEEVCRQRIIARPSGQNRLDAETPEFHALVRQGYYDRWYDRKRDSLMNNVGVNAEGSVEQTSANIVEWINSTFPSRNIPYHPV